MTVRRTDRRGAPRAAASLIVALALAAPATGAHAQDGTGDATDNASGPSADAAASADDPAATGAEAADDAAADAAPAGEDGGEIDAAAAAAKASRATYPTVAIADYVLGCMAANGNSYRALEQCSCSIDFIMERMDHRGYEQAATVMQVQRDIGQRGVFYRDSKWARSRVERLEALQAESSLRCF